MTQQMAMILVQMTASVVIDLLWHLLQNGFHQVVDHIWSHLRLRPTARPLQESEEVQKYAAADLESIIRPNWTQESVRLPKQATWLLV